MLRSNLLPDSTEFSSRGGGHNKRNTKRKGCIKRMQESIELISWKYAGMSLEEELKTAVPLELIAKDRGYDKDHGLEFGWTKKDRKKISKICAQKLPCETFWSNTAPQDQALSTATAVCNSTIFIQNSMYIAKNNEMKPLFENDLEMDVVRQELYGLFLGKIPLKEKSRGKKI